MIYRLIKDTIISGEISTDDMAKKISVNTSFYSAHFPNLQQPLLVHRYMWSIDIIRKVFCIPGILHPIELIDQLNSLRAKF